MQSNPLLESEYEQRWRDFHDWLLFVGLGVAALTFALMAAGGGL